MRPSKLQKIVELIEIELPVITNSETKKTVLLGTDRTSPTIFLLNLVITNNSKSDAGS